MLTYYNMFQDNCQNYESVQKKFLEYLQEHKHRKTPERFAILEEIYSRQGHFDIEDLYISMKAKKYRVSRATLYNTMDLLLNAQLVIKHNFDSTTSLYEKAYNNTQHGHLICMKCNAVLEFCDPRLHLIKCSIENSQKFIILKHSLYFYGLCEKCKGS